MSIAKGAGEFRFGGQHLVRTRKVLVRTIELFGDGTAITELVHSQAQKAALPG